MPTTVTSELDEGRRTTTIRTQDFGAYSEARITSFPAGDPTPYYQARVAIQSDNARALLPENHPLLQEHDRAVAEANRNSRSGYFTAGGSREGTQIRGAQADEIAKAMGLSRDQAGAISAIHLSHDGKSVSLSFKDGTNPELIKSATDDT